MSLRVEMLKKYLNPVFVETGTLDGGGIQVAWDAGFRDIRSIEIDSVRVAVSKLRFSGVNEIRIYEGDSAVVLHEVLSEVFVPITFWLDAHGFWKTYTLAMTPLLAELDAVSKYTMRTGMRVVILIDDVARFSLEEFEKIRSAALSVCGVSNAFLDGEDKGILVVM